MYGKIFICATPIGNLEDISDRLKDTLSFVDIIYAEDTRVTSKLLSYLNIRKPLRRLDENLMDCSAENVISEVKNGSNIAYCSDAGTPCVSDPGMKLVNCAYKNNVLVEAIPGPCAAITAYVNSGFISNTFYFGGFFPKKETQKKDVLQKADLLDTIHIYYESPKRILSTLQFLQENVPQRKICVCRELTKIHEEVKIGNPLELIAFFQNKPCIKGEFVLLIDQKSDMELKEEKNSKFKQAQELINMLKNSSVSKKNILQLITKYVGISKNEAYEIILKEW